MTDKKVADLRQDYRLHTLEKSDVAPNPFQQFEKWFNEALNAEILEPNAMTLATANASGRPSARIVLLKRFDERGFVFYTNFNSRKGQELMDNPFAALVFNWLDLQRQIRINGKVQKLNTKDAKDYFQSRPKKSQIGAWASPQSSKIKDRSVLENKVNELQVQYEDESKLPKPEHWGGFLLVPDEVEFWQGRSSRLHDRIQYQKSESDNWEIVRLAP